MHKRTKLTIDERRELLRQKNIPYEDFLEEYEFLERAKLYEEHFCINNIVTVKPIPMINHSTCLRGIKMTLVLPSFGY
jgi:hypothetical protein